MIDYAVYFLIYSSILEPILQQVKKNTPTNLIFKINYDVVSEF
jgi:hypothetical protein